MREVAKYDKIILCYKCKTVDGNLGYNHQKEMDCDLFYLLKMDFMNMSIRTDSSEQFGKEKAI